MGSDPLQNDVERDRCVSRFIGTQAALEQFYWQDQFLMSGDAALVPVLLGIAFEERVRGEVRLSDETLVARRGDEVVDVLGGTVGIVPRHDGIDGIVAL